MRYPLFLVLLLLAPLVSAAPTSAPVRAEIEALLSKLQESRCEFSRNGLWYTAAEAKAHLLQKLAYMEDRGEVQNTEQFIEAAASKSSFTGQLYRVKCGNTAAVESAQWLSSQLKSIRSPARAAASAPK